MTPNSQPSAGVTNVNSHFIPDFCEAVISDRSGGNLTENQIESALDLWDSILEEATLGSPMTADGFICEEFDLPRGSDWQMCFAAALEVCEAFDGNDHLQQLEEARGHELTAVG